MDQHRHTPPTPPPAREDSDREPCYSEEERLQDRAALVDELRAKVRSGEYKPSIGRISVNIFANLAED
ncbi:hypothetical protein [Desulfocurvus sp. DL9XJH121]